MHLLANLLLLAAWVGTHTGATTWLAAHYARDDRRLEAMLLVGLAVLAWRRFGGPLPALRRLALPAVPRVGPLALLGACIVTEVALARWLDLRLLRACAFVGGGFALVGLYAPPAAWRAAVPWVGLLALTMPFGAFSDVYLGFPARLLTADLVAATLDAAGIAHLSRDTILVFDRPGGATAAVQVDVPCAGVRSLWSALVFLLAAACVEGRRLDRWFAGALVLTGVLLVGANTLRVGALVVIGQVLGAPALADAVHVPLGLLGFAWSVGIGWTVLRSGAEETRSRPGRAPRLGVGASEIAPAPALAPLLAAALALAGVIGPPSAVAPPTLPFALTLPAAVEATAIAPTPLELRFFASADVPPPSKWRFRVGDPGVVATGPGGGGLGGTVLVVPSRAWRAHHQPEACLMGQGLSVQGPWTVAIDAAFPARMARVEDGAATAVWWFQSPTRVTEDLAVRTWAALSGAEDRWVLVSMLLDGTVDAADPALAALLHDLRAAVHAGFPSDFQPDNQREEDACASSGSC